MAAWSAQMGVTRVPGSHPTHHNHLRHPALPVLGEVRAKGSFGEGFMPGAGGGNGRGKGHGCLWMGTMLQERVVQRMVHFRVCLVFIRLNQCVTSDDL